MEAEPGAKGEQNQHPHFPKPQNSSNKFAIDIRDVSNASEMIGNIIPQIEVFNCVVVVQNGVVWRLELVVKLL